MLGREHGRGTGHKHKKFSAHGGTGGLGTAGCAATSLPVRMPQMTMRLELTLNLPASSCMGRATVGANSCGTFKETARPTIQTKKGARNCSVRRHSACNDRGKHARLSAEGGVWVCAPCVSLCVSVPEGVGAVNRIYTWEWRGTLLPHQGLLGRQGAKG